MDWSSQQDKALSAVADWLAEAGGPQVFRLFGYAGTGKTTLARHVAENVSGEVQFGAFTGKAALVLREKGCGEARTIHSMIYRPKDLDSEEPSFVLNEDSPASKASLIVIDECSMVDEELGRDLLSFGKKVLVLGDPAQLPPVKGGGFFTDQAPDIMLTEVHRQAADNPIVRLSMRVRAGERLAPGDHGAMRVMPRAAIDADLVKAADQVLVGLNKTRRAYNRRLRELFGFKEILPEVGEKLVCLRNDKAKGLLNGAIFRVHKASGVRRARYRMSLTAEEAPGAKAIRVGVLPALLDGNEESVSFAQRRDSDEFDYGYALTVHKAQGSQWDKVVLFDESWAFRENRERWLYTGVTRAAKDLTVVI
ncbi:ATP-dependent RecD-like DNA helicase [Rhodoblastus acidophilus]|uniref:ATP-dependent RecD-like DNA helicase n=1 Tax=Candidatus Rhodoblastus alkanivorans TaxID=2954117 RepID=A0ABS9ZCB1_9HYPH|nr:AAA family ATPase [Candidatus Rhodoblastus alkanivorans]MCI4677249.1 ATP-dependent RecD-like DNA helicase [Candidatus Rhodoblastus alkanivorans]MCI4684601.1 ATP-dependent RecD-like DNA helicase [Candidatus Rhodoblastus alkanivorans]MDI4641923.1 ATP-dependent RecD-like DNA helicase [Rhodoblastus acidophilus]